MEEWVFLQLLFNYYSFICYFIFYYISFNCYSIVIHSIVIQLLFVQLLFNYYSFNCYSIIIHSLFNYYIHLLFNNIILRWLTRFESNFAQHHPPCTEVELRLHEPPYPFGYRNRHESCRFRFRIPLAFKHDGPLRIAVRCRAEVDCNLPEQSDILREHVIQMETDGSKAPPGVECEDHLDRGPVEMRIIPPTDPFVPLLTPAVGVQTEVCAPLDAVRQLTEAPDQMTGVGDRSIVCEVEQVLVRTSCFTLRHVVGKHTICEKDNWRNKQHGIHRWATWCN